MSPNTDSENGFAGHEYQGILYGAAYYNEYHQTERLDKDFELMRAAGVSVIRVGESVWAKWQPNEETFDLDWLQPVLDHAYKSGIRVIIGTPTYALPRWVFIKYPEVVAQRHTGAPIAYGHRQNADYSHPTFYRLSEVIIRKIVDRYKDHPAVIGWQVDNEPGAEIIHNANAFEGFKQGLIAEFGTVEKLNAEWGLTYWSHALQSWDELWLPDGNTNPSYYLSWRRHQARITNNFIDWQRKLVRSMVRADQFVTTCVAPNRPGIDTNIIGEAMDVSATNVYYASQDGLLHPTHKRQPGEESPAPMWVPLYGASNLNLQADLARAMRQENFLVTETNAGAIAQGMGVGSFPPYPGQMKQAALAMISRGAEMIEYWHWHTLPYGIENSWGGLLPHSLEPARTIDEFTETGKLIRAVAQNLGRLTPSGDVALVVSTETRWAFELQGPLRNAASLPDAAGYDKTLLNVYDACYTAGLSVRVFGENQIPGASSAAAFAKAHPVLILHSLFLASDALLAFAREYAEAGGHLVLTPRTGSAHPNYVIRTEVQPGALREAAGVSYTEYSSLTKPIPALAANGQVVGHGYAWLDALQTEGAETLVSLDHPFFGKFAAVSTNSVGAGRITYLATYPDYELSKYLGRFLANSVPSASKPSPRSSDASVVVNRATAADGREAYFVFNWSFENATLQVPFEVADVASNEAFASGTLLQLGAWDVRVLVSA